MMPFLRKKLFTWTLPLLLALAAFALSRLNFSQSLERRLLDLRFRARGSRPVAGTPFQIVAIDDQTFQALGQKWPFRASLYAHLIENLNRAGARLIVFDIEFSEPHPLYPQEDSLFAAAIRKAGNVVLSGKIAYTHDRKFAAPYAFAVPPLPVLRHSGAPWGVTNEITDSDDFSRRYLVCLPIAGQCQPSLGMEVLRAYRNLSATEQIKKKGRQCTLGDLRIPLYDYQSFLINYYGPPGTFPAISCSSVLDDSSFDLAGGDDSDYMEKFFNRTPAQTSSRIANPFAGKIILIGASAEELHDNKNTPFYALTATPRKMPGVEMHAHALQTVLDRAFIWHSPPLLVLLLDLILAAIIFYAIAMLKPLRGLMISLAVSLSFVLAAFLTFSRWNYWLDLVSLLICAILAYLGTSLYHYFLERRERARIQEMFAHYVPDQVVKELMTNPHLLKLGGERRRLTVLFADIWNFTSLSEKLPPEQLVIHLNEYMTAMTEIILTNAGIIDKYEGDLIMAEFGAPVFYPDHSARACHTALQMQSQLVNLCQKWSGAGKPALTIRIGINTGDVIVGNMGSRDLFDYTVLGDAVNLCSRLEKANKFYGTGILISQATRDDLPAQFVARALDDLRVRGRSESVRVYELICEDDRKLSDPLKRLLDLYSQGWSFYQARDWKRGRSTFQSALQIDPNDRPSQILLERCAQFEMHPPDTHWDGAFAITVP